MRLARGAALCVMAGCLSQAADGALAQSGVYDYRTGHTYGAQEAPRDPPAPAPYQGAEPPQLNIYSPSGEVIDRGLVDSNGNAYSSQTGRLIGQWRR